LTESEKLSRWLESRGVTENVFTE